MEWLRNAAGIYNNLDGIQESDYDIEETSTGNVEYFNLVVIFCSAIFVISPVFLFVCLLSTSLRRNIRKSLLYKTIRKYWFRLDIGFLKLHFQISEAYQYILNIGGCQEYWWILQKSENPDIDFSGTMWKEWLKCDKILLTKYVCNEFVSIYSSVFKKLESLKAAKKIANKKAFQ